jgi:hypothetical protein
MKKPITLKLFFPGIIFCFLLLASNSFALIGENQEQSDTRYGPSIKSEGDWKTYRDNDLNLQIKVHFSDGVADNIIYSKTKDIKTGKIENLTFEEITIYLDNNSKGEEWSGIKDGWSSIKDGYDDKKASRTSWDCKKLHLSAFYDDENKLLRVSETNDSDLKTIRKEREKPRHALLDSLGL